MATVSESIVVDADRERVFGFLDDPHNHVRVTPSLGALVDREPLANGGRRAVHDLTLAGITVEATFEHRVHDPPERMVVQLGGDIAGEADLSFEAVDGGTRVTYAVEYEVPGPVVGAVAEPFVRRYNERELRATLANVRARFAADAVPNAAPD